VLNHVDTPPLTTLSPSQRPSSSTRHHRRSHSRSRSPPRRRSSKDRSRSPPSRRDHSRSPRRASSRSRSPSPRRMDESSDPRAHNDEPKWAGVPSSRDGPSGGASFDPAQKAASREIAATEAAKRSKKDYRVYVGNLSFGVKWNDLKDFMREGGSFYLLSRAV
jgi:hypothetical protein